jgi:hypothetical protein
VVSVRREECSEIIECADECLEPLFKVRHVVADSALLGGVEERLETRLLLRETGVTSSRCRGCGRGRRSGRSQRWGGSGGRAGDGDFVLDPAEGAERDDTDRVTLKPARENTREARKNETGKEATTDFFCSRWMRKAHMPRAALVSRLS